MDGFRLRTDLHRSGLDGLGGAVIKAQTNHILLRFAPLDVDLAGIRNASDGMVAAEFVALLHFIGQAQVGFCCGKIRPGLVTGINFFLRLVEPGLDLSPGLVEQGCGLTCVTGSRTRSGPEGVKL